MSTMLVEFTPGHKHQSAIAQQEGVSLRPTVFDYIFHRRVDLHTDYYKRSNANAAMQPPGVSDSTLRSLKRLRCGPFLLIFQGVDERVTMDRYNHFHGLSGLSA